jgi:shikimate kinase
MPPESKPGGMDRRAGQCSGMTPDGHVAVGQYERVPVVVICGPIASGKSELSLAVAARLESACGVPSSAIDLDSVYEMLDPQRGPKDDQSLWANARRVAGGLASVLLREGRVVVAEGGDFATEEELAEFERELPEDTAVRLVLLDVDFDTALQRARADESRGVSKDEAFLSRHYAEFRTDWADRDALRLDTGTASLAESARAVVEWLMPRE